MDEVQGRRYLRLDAMSAWLAWRYSGLPSSAALPGTIESLPSYIELPVVRP